jgi:glucose-6-phosphate 1-epimerase
VSGSPARSALATPASERVQLRSADGASAEIHLHGAHLVSWRPAMDGGERLFLSARSEFREGAAIRGGVPVIFPQFATEGPLPRHGFARTSPWTLAGVERAADGSAHARLELRDTAATRAIWPASFLATVTVRVVGEHLAIGLAVQNTGTQPFSFTSALHTYLRVEDVGDVELVGLRGARYRESSAPTVLITDDAETLRPMREVDRVYVDAPHRLVLRERRRALGIEATGFPDVVVWNPGTAAAARLTDMEPGGERRMLCVEAAAVQTPVILAPSQRWRGEQRLVAREP